MLSVVPAVRRKCSVRSVATAAAKVKREQSPTNLTQADRVAALARSKWAPKPKINLSDPSSQAGPSTYKPVPEHPTTPLSSSNRRWSASAAETVPTANWTVRLSSNSKWARPTPAASPPEPSPASLSPKSPAEPIPNIPKLADRSPARTRWPSLAAEPPVVDTQSRDFGNRPGHARVKWAARSEANAPRPDRSNQWTMPQAQSLDPLRHPRPQLPDVPASRASVASPSTSPTRSPLTAPLHSVMDRILPSLHNNEPPHPPSQRGATPQFGLRSEDNYLFSDTRPQRDEAPHLNPQKRDLPVVEQTPRAERSRPLEHPRAALPVAADASLETGTSEKISRPKNMFKERGSLLKTDTHESDIQPKASGPKPKKLWVPVEKRVTEDVYIPSTVSVGHLSRLLSIRLEDLQDKMYQSGMGAQSSFDYVLTADYAVLLAEEFGRKPTVNDEAAFDLYPPPLHPNPGTLPTRPPVVTIMGHVDHGKTTLLDTLRSTSVAKGEVGGITQHIGAFSVPVPSATGSVGPHSITFLDTPGHAAFAAMRARGAQVTDIIVLVVAADDGIMPQTREVIELIKKDREKISVVVAINKIDKPGCNIDALHKALLVEDIHVEDLGGDTPAVPVSGLTGTGLPDLVETLSLMAEIQDLRAEPDGNVFGYVLESKVVKGLGPIATVLVLRGCLKPGSHILSGVHHAKVRIMHDSNGKLVKTASPGTAVTVSGWKSLPSAGDEVLQGTESEIKRAIANRQRKVDIEAALLDVEAINNSRQQERERRQIEAEAETAGEPAQVIPKEEEPTGPQELRLLIKADVSGSAEAVEGALQGIGNHLATTKVISSGVGDILESDVMMAKAVGGMIIGFSVSSNRTVDALAAKHHVPITTNDIIYRLMEDVKARVIKLLPVIIEYKVIAEAKVLQLFEVQLKNKQSKTVAGSRVINGIIEKNKLARVVRDGAVIFQGTFETMRHFKKDVTEIRKGNECGLGLAGFDDLQVDDIIQTYETIEKPGLL